MITHIRNKHDTQEKKNNIFFVTCRFFVSFFSHFTSLYFFLSSFHLNFNFITLVFSFSFPAFVLINFPPVYSMFFFIFLYCVSKILLFSIFIFFIFPYFITCLFIFKINILSSGFQRSFPME